MPQEWIAAAHAASLLTAGAASQIQAVVESRQQSGIFSYIAISHVTTIALPGWWVPGACR